MCVCVCVCVCVSHPWNIVRLWKSPLQILIQICEDLYRASFNPSTVFICIVKWIFFRKVTEEYVCLCFFFLSQRVGHDWETELNWTELIWIFTSSWSLTLKHRKFKFLLLTLRKYFSWSLGCHSKFWFKNIFILCNNSK